MRRTIAALAAFTLIAGAAPLARADEPEPALGGQLAGNTVSAVMFLPHDAPQGGGSLDRVMFQAYLRTDGSALIRRWDAVRDTYTAPAEAHWSVAESTLCLDFPGLGGGDPRICVEAHVWGPRIAGNTSGAGRFALLDGDITPGNVILAAR